MSQMPIPFNNMNWIHTVKSNQPERLISEPSIYLGVDLTCSLVKVMILHVSNDHALSECISECNWGMT